MVVSNIFFHPSQNVIWCRADLRFKIPPRPIPKGGGITALFYDKIGVTDVWYAVTRPAGQAFLMHWTILSRKDALTATQLKGRCKVASKTLLWSLCCGPCRLTQTQPKRPTRSTLFVEGKRKAMLMHCLLKVMELCCLATAPGDHMQGQVVSVNAPWRAK